MDRYTKMFFFQGKFVNALTEYHNSAFPHTTVILSGTPAQDFMGALTSPHAVVVSNLIEY